MSAEIITGDQREIPIQLRKDGNAFDIPGTAVVKVAIRRNGVKISPEVTCDFNHADANWTTSYIIAPFTSTDTNAIVIEQESIECDVEVQIEEILGQPLTWILKRSMTVIRGTIDE